MSTETHASLLPDNKDDPRTLLSKLLYALGRTAFLGRVQVSTLHAIGDSITTGSASGSVATRYPNLIADALSLTLENHSLSSANATRYAAQLLPGWTHPTSGYDDSPASIGTGDLTLLGTGDYNGCRDLGNTATYQTHTENVLRALALYASNPTSALTLGQDAAVTKSGTWTDASQYGGDLGTQSSTLADYVEWTFEGDSLYYVILAHCATSTPHTPGTSGLPDSSGSVYSLTVDSVAIATGLNNYRAYGNRPSINGSDANDTVKLDYAPWGLRYSGFGPGRHTARLTITTASASKPLCLLYAAGSGDRAYTQGVGPVCIIPGVLRPTVAGGVSLTTEALVSSAVAAFTEGQRKVASELASDGFKVLFAPTAGHYANSTAAAVDNVHPNATGHAQISAAFLASLAPWSQPASQHASAAFEVAGVLTVLNRLLVTPVASVSGQTSRLGDSGVSATAFQFVHSSTSADRRINFSGNAIQFVVNSTGALANGTLNADGGNILFATNTAANFGFGTSDFGSGTRVLGLGNRTAAPSGTPAAGGVLYAESGALKWKGSSGTITTIAVA